MLFCAPEVFKANTCESASDFGSANMRSDIPKLLQLYRNGQLDLDSMITNTYKLGDINLGYQDMRDGKNIRGVLIYDD